MKNCHIRQTLHKKCSNTEFFLVRIFPHSHWIRIDTPYSVRMQENADQKKHVFGHFSRSETAHQWLLRDFAFYVWKLTKQFNNQNPNFMKQIFELRKTNRNVPEKYQLNLNISNYDQVTTFGKKSLRIFGPEIWNNLPYHIKSSINLECFKSVIKNCDGVNCNCVICKKS